MDELLALMGPTEAWDALQTRRSKYYDIYAATYSGDSKALRRTSEADTFWRRCGKSKIHVPIAADIAATSADLLFSEEPRIVCYDENEEDLASEKQKRMEFLIEENNIFAKLLEGAETASVLGDVYFKIAWSLEERQSPILSVVQGDSAIAEYRLGELSCIHFFSEIKSADKGSKIYRLYERYEKGKIINAIFLGTKETLGYQCPDSSLETIGLVPEVDLPIDEVMAAHIMNIKPNRLYRGENRGRSDVEGMRSMLDSLDETYTSWIRDIRLAKSRLIIPAEYLRRKTSDMFQEGQYTYSFDEDVETLVAVDIDTDKPGSQAITPSQFQIRADQHQMTCQNLISAIVSMAGYSPQTFGIGIEGNAQSGTALHIREKKSFNTRGKKENYWKTPLEKILTSLVRLDSLLYPGNATDSNDRVKITFPPIMSNDLNSMAQSIEMLNRAQAVSTEVKVQMLHPDWPGKKVDEEIQRVKSENGLNMDAPNMQLGDYENIIPEIQDGEKEE